MTTRPRARPIAPPPEHTITHAALIEYLGSSAVTELVVAETAPNTYRLEASLSWRSGRSVLMGARGAERSFRSLDTVATFLKTAGIGPTIVRLQLQS
jgi:hypothetical protein